MSVQVEPYQLRFLASRLSAGSQELLLKANRLESIMNDLVQGSWKGEGAHAFAIKCEAMKSDIQKAVEVLNNAVQTLNLFANQMDRVNQLRQQANMLEQQSWQYSGDSIDDLHHRQNLARQAAQIRQEAEWEANAADAQAANEFQSIMAMIPQTMAQVGQILGNSSGTGELDDLPEPLRSYYLRHMDLLQDNDDETAATLTMGSFKQEDYRGVSNLEKRHDQLVLKAKEILRRKSVEGYITDPAEIERIVDQSFQLECGDLNDVELETYVQQNSESMQLVENMQNEKHQGIDITKDPEYIAFAIRQGGYEPTGFNPDGVAGMARGRVFGSERVAELPDEFSGVRDGNYDSQSESSGNKSNETTNSEETGKESTDNNENQHENKDPDSNDTSVDEIGNLVGELLKKSSCSTDELTAYLKKLDEYKGTNYADTFASSGKWPEDIQIPRHSNVLNVDGSINWSEVPNGGYVLDKNGNAIKETFVPKRGDIIDRYGPPNGRYTSPVNDGKPYNYEQRSLPYVEDVSKYHQYEVIGDFSRLEEFVSNSLDVKLKMKVVAYIERYYNGDFSKVVTYRGGIAEGFGSLGGGIQYELPLPVEWLEGLGMLKEL